MYSLNPINASFGPIHNQHERALDEINFGTLHARAVEHALEMGEDALYKGGRGLKKLKVAGQQGPSREISILIAPKLVEHLTLILVLQGLVGSEVKVGTVVLVGGELAQQVGPVSPPKSSRVVVGAN